MSDPFAPLPHELANENAALRTQVERERERADDHDSARQAEKERADHLVAQVEELTRERDTLKGQLAVSRFAESVNLNLAKARKLDLQEAEAKLAEANRSNAALTREAERLTQANIRVRCCFAGVGQACPIHEARAIRESKPE